MKRLAACLIVGCSFAVGARLAAARATALPKIKQVNSLSAIASNAKPTDTAAHYKIAWITGLRFRDSTATAAVCVTIKNQSPISTGLHLTAPAARQLAGEMGTGNAVLNHRHHVQQVWERFTLSDAHTIANELTAAAKGH